MTGITCFLPLPTHTYRRSDFGTMKHFRRDGRVDAIPVTEFSGFVQKEEGTAEATKQRCKWSATAAVAVGRRLFNFVTRVESDSRLRHFHDYLSAWDKALA